MKEKGQRFQRVQKVALFKRENAEDKSDAKKQKIKKMEIKINGKK